MKQVSNAVIAQIKETFTCVDPAAGRFLRERELGVVELSRDAFGYDRAVGYAFETAALQGEKGDRLFFVRIDSWDPAYRATLAPGELDYCIPLHYDGASERERLTWKIPFGGAWSDTREEALIVFDQRWQDWLSAVTDQLAFANPGGDSAALFWLQPRDRAKLDDFLRG